MTVTIGAASTYLEMLDKAYKKAALTTDLDINPAWIRRADNSATFYTPDLALIGLGTYSATAGFPDGDATLTWTSHTYSHDRGRGFSIDKVDNDEGALMAFGNLANEFLRVYEVPEIDASRFAAIATAAGKDATGTLSDATGVVAALNTGMDTLDEAEVDDGNKILYITAGLARLARTASSTAATTDALDRCKVVIVPKTRFYTALTLNAGSDASAGGYDATGAQLNFMIVDKSAVFADAKHIAMRTFAPDVNQDADAWKFQFRIVHDCWVLKNRLTGVYVHSVT